MSNNSTGASTSGSGGSGLATCWNGLSNGSGVNRLTSTVPVTQTAAAQATGRHRGDGSLPSGKTKAIAITPANMAAQLAFAHRTAQSAALN